ncbi:MAG: hypothetical protein M4579_000860 [Chaenotheca gracillima]|nr:MAG: hypothetical protein M4579_000860 [Chaenotheca gracillima]
MVLDDSSGQTIDVVCTKPAPRPPTEGHIIREGDVAQSKNKATATISKPRDIDLPDMTGIDLGSVVKIKGGIGEYRGVKQINLKRIHVVPSTAHEVKAWAELATFRADVLSRPWVVSERKQRKLAQRLKGEGKAKKRRKDGDSRGSRIECKEKETRDAVEAEARKAGKGPSTRIRHDADTTGRGDTDETTSNHAAIRNEEPDVIDAGVHRREAVDESITRHIPSEPHQDTSSMFDKNRYRYPARNTSITTHRAQRLPTQRVSGNLRKEPEELQHEDRRDVTPTLDTVHERARVKVDMSKYDALGLG